MCALSSFPREAFECSPMHSSFARSFIRVLFEYLIPPFQYLLPRANQCPLSGATQHALCHVRSNLALHRSRDVSAFLTSCRYDNAMTRCAENDCVKILCIVSCLWIIGWPLKLMLGYDDDSSLTAYYRLLCFTAPHAYCACAIRNTPAHAFFSRVFQHDCALERVLLSQL